MRILFTGASSFSGFWFVRTLAEAGHAVYAVQRQSLAGYTGLRAQRLEDLAPHCTLIWEAPFGSPEFFQALETVAAAGPIDVFCHHAAVVENYKSADFDVIRAVAANTREIGRVLQRLQAAQCQRVVLTGSVFEPGEGAGNQPLRAFSPYGLSKALSAQIAAFYAARAGWAVGKFVIPNPFGPGEEPRFTDYLVRNWAENKTPRVSAPSYVRDNIHVSLLALAYRHFVTTLPADGGYQMHPSGYVESQGAFALRFAAAMRARLGHSCPLEMGEQTEFSEPEVRINTDRLPGQSWGWNENQAWGDLAAYYARRYGFPRATATRLQS